MFNPLTFGRLLAKSAAKAALYAQEKDDVPVFQGVRAYFLAASGAAALLLAACAPGAPSGVYDPYEAQNRDIHAFNVGLDRALVRPAARAYDALLPAPVEQGISNFAHNLDQPGHILNNLLQGRPQYAAQNTLRFAVNSTFGIAGLFDVSSAIGLPAVETDFGETLHVWGMKEGAYTELPLLGPSTDRDTLGTIVDFALNPVSKILPAPEKYVATAAKVGSKLGDRHRFEGTVDSLLYESADSYAQVRLLYLQKRRFELGQTAAEADAEFVDPYEDPYAQ